MKARVPGQKKGALMETIQQANRWSGNRHTAGVSEYHRHEKLSMLLPVVCGGPSRVPCNVIFCRGEIQLSSWKLF